MAEWNWTEAHKHSHASLLLLLLLLLLLFRRIYGPICERGQWRKRCNRELQELYSEPNIVNVIKSSWLRWAGHFVRMDENELPRKTLWTNPGGQRGRGRPKSRWIDGVEKDARKLGCRNWRAASQDRGRWRHLLRRPRPTQGCRGDEDYYYYYY